MQLQLKSGVVHYLDQGSGTPVLLLHAFPLHHEMWAPQIDVLSREYRVIVPDIRGFGEAQPASPWTIADAGDDLDELLQAIGVDHCVVAGVSMGGYIALPFWAKYPKRVRKLVLANTRARADNETEKGARDDMIAAIQQYGTSLLPDRMLPRLLKPNPAPDALRQARRMIEQTHPAAVIYAVTALRDRPDNSTLLQRINCPTLVVSGTDDVIIRLEDSRALADAIPDARFVLVPESGHLPNLENPKAFNAALLDFLRS
jgi:pimeloyl-ACP methyl ester carboxylesterase